MKYLLGIFFLLIWLESNSQNQDFSQIIFADFQSCNEPSRSAFKSYNLGLQMVLDKQYSRAINSFKKAVEKDSLFCGAWNYLAYCLIKKEKLKESKKYVKNSLDIDSINSSARILKAFYLINDSLFIDAQREFERVKIQNPDYPHGYYGIALALYLNQEYEKSKNEINEAEKLIDKLFFIPEKKLIKILKGKILYRLNDENGIKLIEKKLTKSIKDPEANYILAKYYFDQKEIKKARKYIIRANALGYKNIDPELKNIISQN
ncbi:hypothetical protein [uncultured Aquimarina sp.]|uniref:tetratricopeptide repeat protein n=1 Tax=uncultured Aquimarina sp. TaxID=575652 RepID=UPI00261D0788|nr:hypothetical protein [uncultured Aquimarina sp.]